MKFTKCFVVFGLCLLMGACDFGKELDIDIGDYENQLDAWNSRNMPDYQLRVQISEPNLVNEALVTVKNGILEKNDPLGYITGGRYSSTILGFYSYIKELEKDTRDKYESGNSSCSLKVTYNTEYHYPSSIIFKTDTSSRKWFITLMPLVEGDLEIDIGDYENQLDAWNSQNMLDYQIEVTYRQGHYGYNSPGWGEIFNIRNGIPDVASSGYMKNKGTIEEIYSSIKEEEEMTRNEYNGINRSYFNVRYNAVYHYPVQISYGFDHLFGRYYRWEIVLTPNH